MVGKEKLCGNFNYTLNISTKNRLTESEFDELIGGGLTVCFGFLDRSKKPKQRYINGIVYSLEELGMSRFPLVPQIWRYKIEISSWMNRLHAAKECRIFQNNSNTAISIVTDLLDELGCSCFRNETKRSYPKREYVTMYMYNESYYDFIVRLLQSLPSQWAQRG